MWQGGRLPPFQLRLPSHYYIHNKNGWIFPTTYQILLNYNDKTTGKFARKIII